MFTKIALLGLLSAQDEPPVPPSNAPLFGPYTEDTAESYDHDSMSMVWISFKTEVYSKYYYDGDTKKDLAETDATSVSGIFGTRMTKLAGEIEAAVGKKYHIVFFDSKEYKDHAVEGLNCKVDAETCISVLKPMGGGEGGEEDEVVYTKPLPGGQDLNETDEAHMSFILDFVKLVESDGTEKDQYKFTPSFSDDDEGDSGAPPEDEGFGSDEEEV